MPAEIENSVIDEIISSLSEAQGQRNI